MVRFIKYWITRSMEDPTEREEKMRAHLTKVKKRADDLKEEWKEPLLPAGYWNSPSAKAVTNERLAVAEAVSVSPYIRALADMDANKKRAAE